MKQATREQSLAARTLESASAPVQNHPRLWPFPQVLSAAPAPGAAIVVFLRTPRELLTAEQDSVLFLAYFPHFFTLQLSSLAFFVNFCSLCLLQGVINMGGGWTVGTVDHSSFENCAASPLPAAGAHRFLTCPKVKFSTWRVRPPTYKHPPWCIPPAFPPRSPVTPHLTMCG